LQDPTLLKILIANGLDPLNGEARGLLSSLRMEAHYSTADNTVEAQQGYTLNGSVEKAGSFFGGDFDFTETILEARYYLPIAHRAVFAVKARGGSIGNIGGPNLTVPFYRRYFLGAARSLRGWGRFEVSPLFDGITVGGHSMF